MEERVYLEWVLYKDTLHHIGEFVEYKIRPHVLCPLCKSKVILRFGRINRWHVAHLPGRPCLGEDKDTATKYNIKFHIFRELERFKKDNGVILKGIRFCKTSHLDPDYEKLRQLFGNTYCNYSQTFDIASNWDDILLDQKFGHINIDLEIVKNGNPVCLIKLVNPGESVNGKTPNNFQFIELSSKDLLFLPEDNAWTIEKPLTVLNSDWFCDYCSNRLPKNEIDISRKYVLFRFVDFFYPSGKKFRNIFRIIEIQENKEHYLCLENGQGELIKKIPGKDNKENALILFSSLREYLKVFSEKTKAIIDFPVNWKRYRFGEKRGKIKIEYRYVFFGYNLFFQERPVLGKADKKRLPGRLYLT